MWRRVGRIRISKGSAISAALSLSPPDSCLVDTGHVDVQMPLIEKVMDSTAAAVNTAIIVNDDEVGF
jgi:hypothetical protein